MVKTYKKKTNRGEWSEDNMKKAVDSVIEGKMGYLLAAKTFSVPQTTLERKVAIARRNLEGPEPAVTANTIKVPLGPKKQVFSKDEEKELCDYILDMESRLYGLTTKDLKALAYSLAVKNNKQHPFNDDKKEAGKDWVRMFMERHPELSIRKPESTSAARAAGFNKEVVSQFYTFLSNVLDEHRLTPDRIYNCDETGVSVVPKTKSKIIAQKGRKQVGAITSAERGTTITVEICFSASGQYMPPMMVFPRKRMDPQLMLNAAPGAWGVCSDSGWMTAELFLMWFKKFVEFSGATVDRPVLLLLDGHSTHTQNIDLINEARSHGVIILCFPPHTTHRLQVADVAYMRPLSTYYDHQITAWLRSNPGMVVTVRQVAEIFGKAFIQASTMSTAVNGFKKCGIWPFDPTVFSETDFAPSLMTDIPQTERLSVTETQTEAVGTPNRGLAIVSAPLVNTSMPTETNIQSAPDNAIDAATMLPSSSTTEPEIEATHVPVSNMSVTVTTLATNPVVLPPSGVDTELCVVVPNNPITSAATTRATLLTSEPGCSTWLDNRGIDLRPTTPPQQSIFSVVSPQQVMPFPATRRTSRVNKKRGKTAIITSSPYKNDLEETVNKKKRLVEDKQKRKEMRELKKTQKKPGVKKSRTTMKKKVAKSPASPENSDSDTENTPVCFVKVVIWTQMKDGLRVLYAANGLTVAVRV